MLKTTIPYIDLRGKTLVDLLRAYPDKAQAILRASARTYGAASLLASAALLPLADRLSRRFLVRQRNPYLHEIDAMADLLGARGVVTLNVCYEWGCTSGAYATGPQVSLLRVLDWPFPALGRHAVVAHQRGAAGEFLNITWPGLSGVYQALAPGRFAVAINQAPMRAHGLGLIPDWLVNRLHMPRQQGLPPAHALRQVVEQAGSYAEAKAWLTEVPLAIGAIFILTGLVPGEGCVIERLEHEASVRELSASPHVTASNHFHGPVGQRGKGFHPREIDSAGRYEQSCSLTAAEVQRPDFGWLRPPILNAMTRLVMVANAAQPQLSVQGYEGITAVTEPYAMPVV